MFTLFGTKNSGSAAIEIALEWTGAPFRIIRAATWEADSALAELASVNPLKQIPTLQLPDGSVLTESAAILIYLGLEFPAAKLLPADAAKRAQCIRGLVFIAANCYSAVSISDFPERWGGDADDAAKERVRIAARKQLHRHWEIFADVFPAKPYFSGRSPGALDILAAVVSKWSGTRAHIRKERPDFLATIERIENHKKVAPVFARHWGA
jgi:GST-like protein